MAIRNVTEETIGKVLSEHFSPSAEISDPAKLIGREKQLKTIKRALQSPNRNIFIFGERGVGKTSIAKTVGHGQLLSDNCFIYVACDSEMSFYGVIHAIFRSASRLKNELKSPKLNNISGGFNYCGIGANIELGFQAPVGIEQPKNSSEVYDILQTVRSMFKGQILIAIDEFDRVAETEKTAFSELIKNIGAQINDMRIMLCGIGDNVNKLLGAHPSTGRMFEPVEIEKLSHDSLWAIIDKAAKKLGIEISDGYLTRIGIISDGFPHFVHLIGECLFYAILDDTKEITSVHRDHFDIALKSALKRTEPSVALIYAKATEKSRKQSDYEEALWALADRTETKRRLNDIETSYKRIIRERYKTHSAVKPIDRSILNQRLLSLRNESHSKIVVGHGSGFFSFREGVVRGYVRLKAEQQNVQLAKELTE